MRIVDESGVWDSKDSRELFGRLKDRHAKGEDAYLVNPSARLVAEALLVLENWSRNVFFRPINMEQELEIVEQTSSDESTGWWLFSSGTTGAPKMIRHNRETLFSLVSEKNSSKGLTWGLTYEPIRMAGIQVLAQAITTDATVVAPKDNWSVSAKVDFMKENGVNALSATPTFWRQILQTNSASKWDLEQISLGGEIADQKILNALKDRFPLARIVHIFASTETSAAFSVSDGLEGFPVSFLENCPRGIRIAIFDDVLHVYLPDSVFAKGDGFVSTGDKIEVVGQRVFFRGRESGVINVGGVKVWPEQVERVLRQHEYVIDVVVKGKPNPFSGEVVTAEIQFVRGAPEDAISKLKQWVKEKLEKQAVPVIIKSVEAISINSTGKSVRR